MTIPKSISIPTEAIAFVGSGVLVGVGVQATIGGVGLAAMGGAVAIPAVGVGAAVGLALFGAYRLGCGRK